MTMKQKTELTLTQDDQRKFIITGLRDRDDLRLPQANSDIDVKWVKGEAVVSFIRADEDHKPTVTTTNPPGKT